MDDFRKRYDVPRRDYGVAPSGQPPAPARQIPINANPAQQPVASAPVQHQAPVDSPVSPDHQAYQPPQPIQYQPPVEQKLLPIEDSAYHRPAVPAPEEAHANAKPRFKVGYKLAASAALTAVLLVGVGFMLLKPTKTAAVTPADLAKKASFNVYYPSSLPNGYTYNQSLATYDNGGAYYTFAKGYKHIIIRETVTSTGKLDINEVTNPAPLETSVGKAVIGTNTGQTAAAVLAGKTYVFVYSNGSVPQEDITSIVNNLKNISPTK